MHGVRDVAEVPACLAVAAGARLNCKQTDCAIICHTLVIEATSIRLVVALTITAGENQ
jgi:hypothetical protein